jgi:hypothetical protein
MAPQATVSASVIHFVFFIGTSDGGFSTEYTHILCDAHAAEGRAAHGGGFFSVERQGEWAVPVE